MEKKQQLVCQWSPNDKEYTHVHDKFTAERREQSGSTIWSASSARQFLLNHQYIKGLDSLLLTELIQPGASPACGLKETNAYIMMKRSSEESGMLQEN